MGTTAHHQGSLERLNRIASALPEDAVEALIRVAEHMEMRTIPQGDQPFLDRLACVPEEEIDEQTARELREARAVPGEPISLEDLKRELGH